MPRREQMFLFQEIVFATLRKTIQWVTIRVPKRLGLAAAALNHLIFNFVFCRLSFAFEAKENIMICPRATSDALTLQWIIQTKILQSKNATRNRIVTRFEHARCHTEAFDEPDICLKRVAPISYAS